MKRLLITLMLASCASACFKLDSFVWNARHCSTIDGSDVALCEDSKVCTPCDAPYPFASFGIDESRVTITQTPVDIGGGETNDAWFLDQGSDVTVLYAHGNFGGIEHYINRIALLLNEVGGGVNVFAIDYRGFGKSSVTTEPTEEEFMSDVQKARASLDAVLEGREAPSSVAVMGFSAGALGAVEITRTSANCALVLENPWPSVQVFADDSTFIGTPQSFVTDGAWDNIAKMPDVDEPLLHMHATEDITVRLELGQRLFAAANEPKEIIIVEGATHGNFVNDVPTVMADGYGAAIATHLDTNCR
jgi:alpha-beta hydrolase superfamily lysophospholipase